MGENGSGVLSIPTYEGHVPQRMGKSYRSAIKRDF